jgi:hypothetical protein
MKSSLLSILIGLSAILQAQPEPPRNPVSLAGLWAVNLSANFSYTKSEDIQALYAQSTGLPSAHVFPGMDLSLRWHLVDEFYLGMGLGSLSKSYSVALTATGETETYEWNALYPRVFGGLVWYRWVNSYLYFQGEAGAVFLNQGSYLRSGGATETKGTFDGSTYGAAAGLGGVWFALPSVGLQMEGGYRRAVIPASFNLRQGTNWDISHSGPYARLGLTFFWGLKDPWGNLSEAPEAPAPPPQAAPPVK